MKKEFDWENFRNDNLAVICEAKEEAEDFITQCFERDIMWRNKEFHTNYPKTHKDIGYTYDGTLGYSDGSYYKDNNNYEVVYWKDYKQQTRKDMLKNTPSLIVEIGRGDRYMLLGDKICGLDGWMDLDSFDDDLKYIHDTDRREIELWSVNKIYKTYAFSLTGRFDDEHLNLIWERKVKMTKAEIEAELGYEIEIIETK